MNCSMLSKQEAFFGKGLQGGEQQGKGTQENCSATWLAVPDFMVMGLVSRLSGANPSDSGSFLVTYASFSQDGCQREKDSGRWTDMQCLLLTFPELFRLVVAYQFRVPYQDLLS